MSDDVKQILEMVREGKISVEEGEKLISALGESAGDDQRVKVLDTSGRIMRIRVKSSDGDKVNVNIPLGLARAALKFLPNEAREKLAEESIDIDELVKLAIEGNTGSLVDVETEDGDTVQITIE